MVHDSGYAWLVVTGSFVSHYLQFGFVYGLGVFYVLFRDTFQAGPTEVSALCSLFSAVFFASGPVGSLLVNTCGCRTTTIVGGLLASIGLIISAYLPKLVYLYLTFGVLTGLGLGLCLTPNVVIVSIYFRRWRALAMGITLTGPGLGAFTFPLIVRHLVNVFGSRGAVLLAGAILSHLVLVGVIFRPQDCEEKDGQKEGALGGNCHLADETRCGRLQLCIFRRVSFCLMCVLHLLVGFGQTIVFTHLAAFGVSLGLSDDRAAILVSAVGISNFFGRFSIALLPLIAQVGIFKPFISGLLGSGSLLFLTDLPKTFVGMMSFSVSFGFIYGSFGCLQPLAILEVVGEHYFSTAYGYLSVALSLGSLLGASTAGWLYERTGYYPASFYMSGTALLLAGVMAFLSWRSTLHLSRETLEVQVHAKEEGLLTQEQRIPEKTSKVDVNS